MVYVFQCQFVNRLLKSIVREGQKYLQIYVLSGVYVFVCFLKIDFYLNFMCSCYRYFFYLIMSILFCFNMFVISMVYLVIYFCYIVLLLFNDVLRYNLMINKYIFELCVFCMSNMYVYFKYSYYKQVCIISRYG